MVDYRKWDSLAAEISDSEEDVPSASRVTTLQGGQSVSIGPSGLSIGSSTKEESDKQSFTKRKTDKASRGKGDEDSRNGGVNERFKWRQTAEDVTVKAILQRKDLKAKDIKIEVRGENNNYAKKVLLVLDKANNTAIIEGTLRYPIAMNEEEGEDPIDWEVTYDAPHRYVVLTMRKQSPIPGAVHWWNAVFEGDTEIDVEAIPDRQGIKSKGASKTSPTFADNWAEANRLFKERVGSNKVNVDM